MRKNSLNNIISHLSWLKKLSPTHTHPLISIREFFETLQVIIFGARVTHKKLSVNSSTWITNPPTPTWPTPPHPYMTHPTPAWPTPPHLYMIHPTPPYLYMTHPCMTHPTPPPCMTHPTPPYPYMTHPTPPHPWYIFGHKGAFFHGLLHYVSLSVDNKISQHP